MNRLQPDDSALDIPELEGLSSETFLDMFPSEGIGKTPLWNVAKKDKAGFCYACFSKLGGTDNDRETARNFIRKYPRTAGYNIPRDYQDLLRRGREVFVCAAPHCRDELIELWSDKPAALFYIGSILLQGSQSEQIDQNGSPSFAPFVAELGIGKLDDITHLAGYLKECVQTILSREGGVNGSLQRANKFLQEHREAPQKGEKVRRVMVEGYDTVLDGRDDNVFLVGLAELAKADLISFFIASYIACGGCSHWLRQEGGGERNDAHDSFQHSMVEYYPSDYAGYKLGEIDDPEEENTEETFDVSDLADYRRTEYYNPSYTGYKLGSLS